MLGNQESANTKLKRVEKELKETLARKGLIEIAKPEVDHYMTMSFRELGTLPSDELGMVGFEIARYGYYLQILMNQYATCAMICKREIEKLVGPRIHAYNHLYGRDEKWLAAIADDPQAVAWKDLEDEAMYSLRCLEYIPNRLNEMMRSIIEIQQGRRRFYGGKV